MNATATNNVTETEEAVPKLESAHVEYQTIGLNDAETGSISSEAAEDAALLRRVLLKIDLHVVPILGGLYLWSLIDRTNLGGARIAGIDDAVDLKIGNRASVVILVFYIGYILVELPSNMILQKVGPAKWLGALAISWGIVTLCVGFVRSWQVLAIMRVLLGILEGGMFPGCIYLMSSWYCRYEYQKRAAVYFLIGSFFSSFSNILAYGLTQIAGQPERDGWKWIFIVEGAITVGYGIMCLFVIPDLPYMDGKNNWLSVEEKALVKRRLIADTGSFEGAKVTWRAIWETLRPPHMWTLGVISLTGAAGSYSFLLFLPIILRRGLGFSLQSSFLLTAPPAAFSALYSFSVAFASDRLQKRGLFVVLSCSLTLVGLCMIAFLENPTTRYIGTFFGQGGVNALLISVNAWGMNNVRGDAKRNVYSAYAVTLSSIGGIYSALVFRQQDAPDYLPGVIATGALVLLSLLCTIVTIPWYVWANKQADQGKRIIEGLPSFRYTL